MRVVHLCFHGIGSPSREREPGEARYWVDDELFLRTLDEVAGRADVRLSFDDGNRSDVEVALPALRERGLRARFFALAGRLDDPLSLGADDLRLLVSAGMEVGSHGWAHVSLRGLDDRGARRELQNARRTIEEAAGCRVTELALPLGQYDRELLGRLRDAGYDRVFTSDRRPARENTWLQPRYSITSTDTIASVRRILSARRSVQSTRSALVGAAKRLR
ncbi:polysaccharide deacetylase family protein [Microbacterium sp. AZCO]|uniref:polysaccharide deacetylase family protein n=1 Tax=Microbacterium sp. AZCO TaxID=3142976 RepID=UPI0031F41B72